jgi:hypothetical protein
MTGQVKEEILTRLGELGLFITEGIIVFNPVLLRAQEFLSQPQTFHYVDIAGQSQIIELAPGSLAYTFCQVPIVYITSSVRKIDIIMSDGRKVDIEGNRLNAELSQHLFNRDAYIKHVMVFTQPAL